MATISVVFDTVAKSMTATMDGNAIADCCGVMFERDWEEKSEYCCCIMTSAEDEVNDVRTVTRMMASTSVPSPAIPSADAPATVAAEVAVAVPSLESDVSKFMSSGK